MATTDAEPRFVDTNVLVYANQFGSAHHAAATVLLRQTQVAGAALWISGQVLREYLAAVTRSQVLLPPCQCQSHSSACDSSRNAFG
jgi:predicted nucleic acid-binding protein